MHNNIKKYIKTFKTKTAEGRFRTISFFLFALIFSLLINVYFLVLPEIKQDFINNEIIEFITNSKIITFLFSTFISFMFTIIVDSIAGIGRESPIFKIKK